MKRFFCQCGNEIFFENTVCMRCGGLLGYAPGLRQMLRCDDSPVYRFCQQRDALACNWLIAGGDSAGQCLSCRLTRTIPSLAEEKNRLRWFKLEATKRRALAQLLDLRLPLSGQDGRAPMLFDFLESSDANRGEVWPKVVTGHADGVITLDIAEADDSQRCATQDALNEAYRTLLGHFRHEFGHYFWLRLQNDHHALAAFRARFGDERQDYTAALAHYYQNGPSDDWRQTHISAYASAHPLEDWAECWAHYLHIRDTMETAAEFGLISMPYPATDFAVQLTGWMAFSVTLNALNRSMGISDPYPFVINPVVQDKLGFVAAWVEAWG